MLNIILKKVCWFFLDLFIQKDERYWVFPTHYIQVDKLKDNSRAVFEKVKSNKNIKKIIVYRGESFQNNIDRAENTVIVRHGSWRFFYLLAKAKTIFLANSISMDFSFRFGDRGYSILKINQKNRNVINLWHGIPLKGVFFTAPEQHYKKIQKSNYRVKERLGYSGLVSSSNIDSYVMASSFYPLNYSQIWITGLPRNDFLLMSESELPSYMYESLIRLKEIKKDKKLIVYAPTHRQKAGNSSECYTYYEFTESEIIRLKQFLKKNNFILGYRPHYFKSQENDFDMLSYVDNEYIFDLSIKYFDDFSTIAREMDVLITDYSSVYMDALFLSKPVISFAYDIESYKKDQDGLLYDISKIFSGLVFFNFESLITCLESGEYSFSCNKSMQDMFYKYIDSDNSQRVIERIYEKNIEKVE